MIPAAEVSARFASRFGDTPQVFWAPGRVNLIGDHIDYCGGTVLPMSIQFGTTIGVRVTHDGRIQCISDNAPTEPLEMRSGTPRPFPPGSWGRFVSGSIAVLAERSIAVDGANLYLHGDIPGSGLSSSASLTVGLLFALAHLARRPLPPLDLALAAQRVEHEHVGVQCGLMDQAAVTLSRPGAALLFDCSDHRHRSIPLDSSEVEVLVADTRRARQLVHSQYNARLAETRAAASLLSVEHAALARVPLARFRDRENAIRDPVIHRRARHVVTEAARVFEAAAALERRDWHALGRALNDSHASLRDDYEVSCPELDVLAGALESQPGCYGARMTGAGFGGNVVALFDAHRGADAMPNVAREYRARFGVEPTWFVAQSLGGVRRLDD